jgi:hypothetical protein
LSVPLTLLCAVVRVRFVPLTGQPVGERSEDLGQPLVAPVHRTHGPWCARLSHLGLSEFWEAEGTHDCDAQRPEDSIRCPRPWHDFVREAIR